MRHNAVVPFIGTDAMALGFLLGARSFKTAPIPPRSAAGC